MTDPSPAALLDRDAQAFFHQEGSTPCLAALARAEGAWLETVDGHRLLDLHGNTAHHFGHAHPRLLAALQRQAGMLSFSPRRYTNAAAVDLAEALLARWPGKPRRVLFATGGSDAIEIALRLAVVATGRPGIVSLEGSFHGNGFGALGLSSARLDPALVMLGPTRHHVTPYWDAASGGAERMAEQIAMHLRGGAVAAVIAEPLRSSCHVPPAWLWPEIRRQCDTTGTRLIFDEIPSGLGKTGRFFAFEHFGAEPDLVVLGKALGGGLLPIAAVIGDAALDVAPELNLGHYTHEKNPLTAAVALEGLRIIAEDDLVGRAERLGALAEATVAGLAGSGRIRGLRGLGLLRAVELHPRSGRPAEAVAEAAVRTCLRLGVSTTTKPGGALGFSPPLVTAERDLVDALHRIDEALATS